MRAAGTGSIRATPANEAIMTRLLRENLEIVTDGDVECVQCSRCRHRHCRAGQDWKQFCKARLLPPTAAGSVDGRVDGRLPAASDLLPILQRAAGNGYRRGRRSPWDKYTRRHIMKCTTLTIAIALSFFAHTASAQQLEKAVFAGGCFWCVESDFDKIPGVTATISGYTGGKTKDPDLPAGHGRGHGPLRGG